MSLLTLCYDGAIIKEADMKLKTPMQFTLSPWRKSPPSKAYSRLVGHEIPLVPQAYFRPQLSYLGDTEQ
jgi:hypothetical protein